MHLGRKGITRRGLSALSARVAENRVLHLGERIGGARKRVSSRVEAPRIVAECQRGLIVEAALRGKRRERVRAGADADASDAGEHQRPGDGQQLERQLSAGFACREDKPAAPYGVAGTEQDSDDTSFVRAYLHADRRRIRVGVGGCGAVGGHGDEDATDDRHTPGVEHANTHAIERVAVRL